MTQRTFEIGGMTCGHCVSRVKNALTKLPGLTVEQVKVGAVTVAYDEAVTDASVIAQAIEDAGYDVLQTK